MGAEGPTAEVERVLARAVAAGVISAEQAAAISDLHGAPAAGPRRGGSGGPVLAEVLGYLGGAVTLVAALLLGERLWAELAAGTRVGVLALVALATLLAGAGLRDRAGAASRLGGFLWFVAVVAVAGLVAVAADGLLGWSDRNTVLAAALAGTATAAALWWVRREVLQQVALFVGLVATAAAILDRIDPSLLEFAGATVWLVGLGWLALARFDRVAPVAAAWVLGSIAAVLGPLAADWGRPGMLVAGVLTAAALVVIGVRSRRWPVVVIGTAGLFLLVPATLGELFGTALLPLWVALVAGIGLLVVGVLLARRLPTGTGAAR
ncbi:MAG: hypothetical protein ACRDRZ_05965 [Pseudonocardiaceae bacterium]